MSVLKISLKVYFYGKCQNAELRFPTIHTEYIIYKFILLLFTPFVKSFFRLLPKIWIKVINFLKYATNRQIIVWRTMFAPQPARKVFAELFSKSDNLAPAGA